MTIKFPRLLKNSNDYENVGETSKLYIKKYGYLKAKVNIAIIELTIVEIHFNKK